MAASVMLRQRNKVTHLSKILRQSNINIIKFSSDSKDDKGDKGGNLSGLLASLGKKKTGQREPKLSMPKGVNKIKKGVKSAPVVNIEELEPEMVHAAKDVAKTSKEPENTESDLLKKLKEISQVAKESKSENVVSGEKPNLSELFGNIKVEKKPEVVKAPQASRFVSEQRASQDKQNNLSLEQKAFLEKRAALRRQKASENLEETYVPIDLFGAPPLGIFTDVSTATSPDAEGALTPIQLTTWQKCADRELTLLSTPAPRNALEEQIEWTLQGKLWKFPINNEQDLDYSEEKFHQHLFLDQHIQAWCPQSGPVRHFMELVCVGLSKNPYVSVQYKMDTLDWFKTYFYSQEINEVLVHQGAWPDHMEAGGASNNNLEGGQPQL